MTSLAPEVINAYLKAGKIASEVKRRARGLVRKGVSLFSLAQEIEGIIRELGGSLAFPVNLSIGSIAAHYSPLLDSKEVLEAGGILKIDIGVHVNGYIADTAISIDLDGENEDLIKAAQEAVERVREILHPGVKLSLIGETIERVIRSYGATPIRNLTGHGLERFKLHTGLSIPNVSSFGIRGSINSNSAVAIEPFSTKGKGYVVDGKVIGIYSLKSVPPKKLKSISNESRSIYERIYQEREELPFSERWYASEQNFHIFRNAVSELLRNGAAQQYPVLIEISGSQVAQAEESFLILDKEVITYTSEK
ncbi:MAG: type II methionyl aminopeptidase [Fervidicoccaceae archaeon]